MDLCGLPLGRPAFSMKKIQARSPPSLGEKRPSNLVGLPASPALPLPLHSFPSPPPHRLTEPECRKLCLSTLPLPFQGQSPVPSQKQVSPNPIALRPSSPSSSQTGLVLLAWERKKLPNSCCSLPTLVTLCLQALIHSKSTEGLWVDSTLGICIGP